MQRVRDRRSKQISKRVKQGDHVHQNSVFPNEHLAWVALGVVTVCDKSVKYGYIRVYTRGLFMRHYRPGIKAGRLLGPYAGQPWFI